MNDINYKNIISFLKGKIDDLQAIYVYGSAVSDVFSEKSDLDVAIKARSVLDKVKRWDYQEDLAILMGRDVDLLDMDQASLVMKYEVLTTGDRIYCQAVSEIEKYETVIYSRYLEFNEIRKPIIEAAVQRGRVYGDR